MSQHISARDPRLSVMLNAVVTLPGRPEPTRHRVINLSSTGIQLAKADHLRAGEAVTLSVGAVQDIAAETIWQRNGAAGLRFREPIDLAAARRVIASGPLAAKAGWIADLNDPYRRLAARR